MKHGAALAALLVVVGAGACKRGAPARDARVVTDAAAGVAVVDAGAADAAVSGDRTVRIPDETRALVVAVVPGWDATDATVRHWRRGAGGAWTAVGASWPAVIGHTGAAWGRGLHGDGAPDGRGGPVKVEGDGRSPAGLFAIGPAFGYAAAPPAGTRVPYTAVDDHWRCVDDPASRHYNRVLDESTVAPDWASAEDMRRTDELYRWVVEVRHNPAATPRGGSCIFFHLWSGPGTSTVGCTAMARADLERLLVALDPADQPVFALLPADEYAALAAAWGLP